jgi:hypothetical protein
MEKTKKILLNALPVLLMIGLIPIIANDYVLTLLYIALIALFLKIKFMKGETLVFLFGFFAMMISEYVFISTGAEVFVRNSLFGVMPLWLPFLWGYSFIAIKRSIKVLNS